MNKLLKYVAIAMVALATPVWSIGGVEDYRGPLLTPIVEEAPKITHFIKKTNPALSDSDALYLARTIEGKAKEHGIHPVIFAALIRQESSFRLNLKVCHGFEGNCDYGLGQISSIWVKAWKLDTKRLQYDVGYNLDISARIIHHYIELRPKDKNAYSLYYNANPEFRKDYEKRIQRWARLASL
jgi:hypothetical protein